MARWFLEQFATEVYSNTHVVMIWDQAGFHCAKKPHLPAYVTILPSPPCSPELNPIENLWPYPRRHHWSNRKHADYDALRETSCDAWKTTCLDTEFIGHVCSAPYLDQRKVKS